MLALLHKQEAADLESETKDLPYASDNAMKLFEDIESTISSLDLK